MDIYIGFFLIGLVYLAILVGLYVFVLLGAAYVVQVAEDNDAYIAERVITWLGAPLRALAWVLRTLANGMEFPWRKVNQWHLDNTFDIAGEFTPSEPWFQRVIDDKLMYFAQHAMGAFERQERARHSGYSVDRVKLADEEAERAKKKFWRAHALARRNGADVRGPSIKAYIPETSEFIAETLFRQHQ